MDLNLKWFYAFNRKGNCWDGVTTNLLGELRLGLDADRNFMTVYAYAVQRQQVLRVAYRGSIPLQGVPHTLKTIRAQ